MNYSDLEKYKYNIHSQNGEDGVIQELLLRLEGKINEEPWCVEFGAWDGIHMSNTFNLVKNGWNAFYIEGDFERYKNLKKTCYKYNKLFCEFRYIEKDSKSPNSLDNILKYRDIPRAFDILSIDIDSFDLEIWESLKNYSPKIVIIEVNSGYLPGIIKWHKGTTGNKYGGNSFSATLMVAQKKGYHLVCHTGNMIFVKKEYIDLINLDKKYITYPELLFDDSSVVGENKISIFIFIKNFIKKIIKNTLRPKQL